MTQSTPAGVTSNVSAWVKPTGYPVPTWLADPATDQWVLYAGLLVLAATAMLILWPVFLWVADHIGARVRPALPSLNSPLAIEFVEIDSGIVQPSDFRSIASCYYTPPGEDLAESHALVQIIYLCVRHGGGSTVTGVTATVEEIGFGVPPPVNPQRRIRGFSKISLSPTRFQLPIKGERLFEASIRPKNRVLFVLLKVTDIGFEGGVIPSEIGSVDGPTMQGLKELAKFGVMVGDGGQDRYVARNDGVKISISIHGDDVSPVFGRFYFDLRARLRGRYREFTSLDQGENAVVDPL